MNEPVWVDLGTERFVAGPTDAESFAAEILRAVGQADARVTGSGPDGGIDVSGSKVMAQVKHHTQPVGRPDVQRLLGAAEPGLSLVFFALSGFSRPAIEFADGNGIALLIYSMTGQVAAANREGRQLLDGALMSDVERAALAADSDLPERQELLDRARALSERHRRIIEEAARLEAIAVPTGEEKRQRRRLAGQKANADLVAAASKLSEAEEGARELRRSRFRSDFHMSWHIGKLERKLTEVARTISFYERRARTGFTQ